MTSETQDKQSSNGLLQSLKDSPATKQLGDHARGLASAQADRVSGALGRGVSSVAGKLTDLSESGELPPIGEGAKRLISGDGPLKAAVGAAKSGVTDKAKGLIDKVKGGGKGKGGGKNKSMNIEESIDVGVPVSTAYNQWTQFTEFGRFMKGVESVEQVSETETNWRAKVFKSRRSWKATIQEQIPDHRIVWTSEGGKGSTKGVVTFHPLGEDLTRVLLTLEYYPAGLMEKTGNIWRAAGRRARLDLKNFRKFVMLEGQETGEWRGEIRDGKVTKQSGQESKRQPKQESKPQSKQKQGSQRETRSSQTGKRSAEGSKAPATKSGNRGPAKKAPPAKKSTGGQSSSERPRRGSRAS